MAVIRRFLAWLLTLAICLDQLLQVLIRGPIYVLFNGPKPSADETLSDWVGQSANDGKGWAIEAQLLIDAMFFNPNHCQQAIIDDAKD